MFSCISSNGLIIRRSYLENVSIQLDYTVTSPAELPRDFAPMKTINRKVVLADDHTILREGLKSLVNTIDGYEVVGEAENGLEAVEVVRKLKPDIVIMDIGMPNLNGIAAASRILRSVPTVRILALSMHTETQFVREMLDVGASGYLLKDCAFEELEIALNTITKEQTYLSPGVTSGLIHSLSNSKNEIDSDNTLSRITRREREVLQLLAEGYSTTKIADKLNISDKTVESHRKNLMDKLEIKNIAELTKFAIRTGLTSI